MHARSALEQNSLLNFSNIQTFFIMPFSASRAEQASCQAAGPHGLEARARREHMPWRPLRAARTTADAPRRAQKGAPKCQRSRDRGGPEAAKPRRSRAICGAVAAVHTPDGGGRAMRPVAWACGGGRARSARARSAQTAHEATRRARRAQCHGALDRGAAVRGEEAGGAVPGAPPARDQKVGASARGRAPCRSVARSS